MDLALLKAEMDVGMYEDRRLALEEMLREGLLPQELHEQIVGVFRTWKLQPIQKKCGGASSLSYSFFLSSLANRVLVSVGSFFVF